MDSGYLQPSPQKQDARETEIQRTGNYESLHSVILCKGGISKLVD